MNPNLIYYPCFAMLILSFCVLLRMFQVRVGAIRSKKVDFRYFKTYHNEGELPLEMLQAGRNFSNLFEVPTLFYMVCTFALITRHVDQAILAAAWIYVALRVGHSFVHLTNNKIMPRMITYFGSWLTLMFMGITLAMQISLGS